MADSIQTTRKTPSGLSPGWCELRTCWLLRSDQSEQTAGLSEVTIFGSGFA